MSDVSRLPLRAKTKTTDQVFLPGLAVHLRTPVAGRRLENDKTKEKIKNGCYEYHSLPGHSCNTSDRQDNL